MRRTVVYAAIAAVVYALLLGAVLAVLGGPFPPWVLAAVLAPGMALGIVVQSVAREQSFARQREREQARARIPHPRRTIQ